MKQLFIPDNYWLIISELLQYFTAYCLRDTYRVVVKSNLTSVNVKYCLPFLISTFGINLMLTSTLSARING